MSRVRSFLAAGLALASLAGPSALAAKDPPIVPSKTISENYIVGGKAGLDPTKGYIFLHAPGRFTGTFVRAPDEQDRADYRVLSDKEYAKQVKAYPGRLAKWRTDTQLAEQTKHKLPAKPDEPTREGISIGDIELRTTIAIGPMFMFSKSEDGSEFRYMQEVKPGTYIFYGPVMSMPNGVAFGTCYCMGSVRFQVKAGEVTDLGDFLSAAPDYASQKSADLPTNAPLAAAHEPRYGLPASLAGKPSSRALFHASGKLNNFYGITLSRMPPVPGVLAYRRDTVIDVASGQAVAPGSGQPTEMAAAPGHSELAK